MNPMLFRRKNRAVDRFLCLEDFRAAARRALPRPLFGYVDCVAEDGLAFAGDRQSFRDFSLIPRVLNDVSQRSTATSLFGKTYRAPIGIAPMGLAALMAYRGDLVLSQAAAAAEIPMIVSGSSLIRLEDLADATDAVWFQAYLPAEDSRIDALLDRVRRAGYDTLVITVDIAAAANRENYRRIGFSTPFKIRPRLVYDVMRRPGWLLDVWMQTLLRQGVPHFENSFATRGAPILSGQAVRDFSARGRLTWDTLGRVRDRWHGRLILKGVLSPADGARAVQCGVDGLIVSNHGGRQLDASVAPLRVLADIVSAAQPLPVMLDGGVRRGTDVLKALALGARFVFIGRPFLYAAAAAGRAGVERAIMLIQAEVDRNMGLLGINRLAELDPSFLQRHHGPLQ